MTSATSTHGNRAVHPSTNLQSEDRALQRRARVFPEWLGLRLHTLVVSALLVFTVPVSADEKWRSDYDALFDSIMVRESGAGTYGRDVVYPLLWMNSRYLISGDRFDQFVESLDDFSALSQPDVESIPPIRRAILQRHLWAVFDWTTILDQGRGPFSLDRQRLLQSKIAPLIRRLAMGEDEIRNLPNNFAATADAGTYPKSFDVENALKPFFPASLYDEDGPWVLLRKTYHPLTAKIHTQEVQSRSAFQVFLRLPGDRKATLKYIDKLAKFEKQWVTEKPRLDGRTTPNGGINYVEIFVNPETPQFPVGTQVALVDQALLIDRNGKIVASPLTNTLQIRAYLRMELSFEKGKPNQAFAEFVMQPLKMMEGKLAMRAIGVDEVKYSTILSGGDQLAGKRPVPQPARLTSCIVCHSAWGIHSVNSRAEFFQIPRSLQVPRFQVGQFNSDSDATIRDKRKTYSWGLLNGLWRADGS